MEEGASSKREADFYEIRVLELVALESRMMDVTD